MRKAKLLMLLTVILAVIAIVLIAKRCQAEDVIATEDQIAANIESLRVTPSPEPLPTEPIHVLPSEDVTLLAKIMQEEDGHDWPDAMIMCIGEVVLNRVNSPEFPDSIREVLYQVDGGFIQYAPVHHQGWERITPEDRYIELAERLLAGERVMDDPQIIYQATFEQGRGTVLTYHDFYIGSTTYFCLTDSPGLYG